MRYIPDLIPEKSKVDIDFSKRYILEEKQENIVLKKLEYNFQIILCSIFILVGVINLFTRFYVAVPLIFTGLLIIPDVRSSIERLLKFKFTLKLQLILYAILIAISCAFIPQYVKEEERIAALEKAEKERERIEREKKVAEENLRHQLEYSFLSEYPFIQTGEYRDWLITAKDSITNHDLKIANFTKKKKKEYLKRQQEEIKIAKAKERERIRKEKREREIYEANNTYNGHVIHTGPRGGRYYINSNGNKTYIKH